MKQKPSLNNYAVAVETALSGIQYIPVQARYWRVEDGVLTLYDAGELVASFASSVWRWVKIAQEGESA